MQITANGAGISTLKTTSGRTGEFDYNIRNWTTRIKSGSFEEKLYYNTSSSIFNDMGYKQFNGNISASTWTYGNSLNGYQYNYDKLNHYTGGYALVDGAMDVDYKFSEWYYYDKMGNILSLTRWDNYDTTDELTLTYNGNQLKNVQDYGVFHDQYNTKEYQNKAQNDNNDVVEMTYDTNGNLTKDLDRDIYIIKYNILNLPDSVQFKNGSVIFNLYDALGKKLKSEFYGRLTSLTTPVTDDQVLVPQYNPIDYIFTGTAYFGIIEYKIGKLKGPVRIKQPTIYLTRYGLVKLHNTEGYVESPANPQYYYFRKDHLGNNREVWLANADSTVQRTQYYPSGLPWASNSDDNPGLQNKKYNGKEFVEMHGLDEYDSEARWYYPAIMRTTTIDPLAEKYYSISPYAWCGNNPVNAIDPDGMDIYRYDDKTGEMTLYQKNDDKTDQIGKFKYNKKSGEYELKTNKKGEAKTRIDGIEKSILSDGMNFKTESNLIQVGGENQASVAGVEKFAVEFSEMIGKELSGYYLADKKTDNINYVHIGRHENNKWDKSYKGYSPHRTYPDIINNVYEHTDWHTHPATAADSDRTRPSGQDLESKKSTQQSHSQVKMFIILTKGYSPIKY